MLLLPSSRLFLRLMRLLIHALECEAAAKIPYMAIPASYHLQRFYRFLICLPCTTMAVQLDVVLKPIENPRRKFLSIKALFQADVGLLPLQAGVRLP